MCVSHFYGEYPKSLPSKPSDVLHPFSCESGDRFVTIARVSCHTQGKNGNLREQQDRLQREVVQAGGIVTDSFSLVCSGKDPSWLVPISQSAHFLDSCLVGETTCRFKRPMDYHSQDNPHAVLLPSDLEWLKTSLCGVKTMTLVDPDYSPGENRSVQTKRGMTSKGKKGGRPRKQSRAGWDEERRLHLPIVISLRDLGYSLSMIADRTGVKRCTVQKWLEKYG